MIRDCLYCRKQCTTQSFWCSASYIGSIFTYNVSTPVQILLLVCHSLSTVMSVSWIPECICCLHIFNFSFTRMSHQLQNFSRFAFKSKYLSFFSVSSQIDSRVSSRVSTDMSYTRSFASSPNCSHVRSMTSPPT